MVAVVTARRVNMRTAAQCFTVPSAQWSVVIVDSLLRPPAAFIVPNWCTGNLTFLELCYGTLVQEYAWWMQAGGEYGHAGA